MGGYPASSRLRPHCLWRGAFISEEPAAYLLAVATKCGRLPARFERMARSPAYDDDEELPLQGIFAG